MRLFRCGVIYLRGSRKLNLLRNIKKKNSKFVLQNFFFQWEGFGVSSKKGLNEEREKLGQCRKNLEVYVNFIFHVNSWLYAKITSPIT